MFELIIDLKDMKTRIPALILVVLFGVMPARSEGTNHVAYEAYWLTNKALGEYVKLILTRRPFGRKAQDQPHTPLNAAQPRR
jgi:hypothetical protein